MTVFHKGLLEELSKAPTERALTVGEALRLIAVVNNNSYVQDNMRGKICALTERVEELETLKLPCQEVSDPEVKGSLIQRSYKPEPTNWTLKVNGEVWIRGTREEVVELICE